jgi:hypothetical protein
MAQASLESAVLELRCLLTQNVHEQLIAGGEPGLTQLTLERWLKARKVGLLLWLLGVRAFHCAACSLTPWATLNTTFDLLAAALCMHWPYRWTWPLQQRTSQSMQHGEQHGHPSRGCWR